MSLIDCLLLTLVNAAICITLPKVLYVMKLNKSNSTVSSQTDLNSQKA